MSRFGVTEANPTDKTISLAFFSPVGGGVWGGARQKIERKWFWSGGRPRYEGDGASQWTPMRTRKFRATTRSARGLFVKILRILFVKSSNFVQKTPPNCAFARNGEMWGVALRRQVPFLRYAPRFFQSQRKRAVAHEVVRLSKAQSKTKVLQPIFLFALFGRCKAIFSFDCPKAKFSIQV